MSAPTGIRVDTREFSDALKLYMVTSKRELSEVINQKAYSISMAAVAMTRRAEKAQIRRALMADSRNYPGVPLAAIIINSRARTGTNLPKSVREITNGRGLYGDRMRRAVREFVQQKADASNFLRAGWLAAVAVFARAINPKRDLGQNAQRFLSRFGYRGEAYPAKPGIVVQAEMHNMALSRHTSTRNGIQFAEDGLRRAMAQEVARMRQHVEQKLQAISNRLVARFIR